ncbi:MAG: polysaccharide pyruvyl transferase family protein [Actinobacteria bacterium]|nr:polysaccharide pyruvyl transferase family protein [Actinomycetota bacterium]
MRVTVAAWIGSANAGDELIFAALHRKLLARGTHVTAITTGPTDADGSDVERVGHLSPAAIRAVWSADALLVGGGGLLQDQTSAFNLPYHLSRPALAAVAGIPRGGVGLGAGPLRTAAGRAQVRRALRGAVAISVRDRQSVEVLREIGVDDVRLGADLAFSLPSPQAAAEDVICACLRPWRAAHGWLPVRTRGGRDVTAAHMVTRLARGLDQAAARLRLPVRMVAMQRDWDDLLHRRVADHMRAPVTLVSPRPQDVLEVIAASRVVVAMRYHAAIGALLAGRPATLIGYDPKLAGLAEPMGPSARLLPWTADGLDGLGAAIVDVTGRDDGLEAALAALRARERVNDTVLDDVLALAEAGG